MLPKLPGWVVSDEESLRDEVRDLVGTTPAERWQQAVLLSRDAMWAVRASGMAERVLLHEDPLPESTIRALARLRLAAGWPHGGG